MSLQNLTTVTENFQLNPITFSNIKQLELTNNVYLAHSVQAIIDWNPVLEVLNVQGIRFEGDLKLSSLLKLRELTFSYYHDFTKTVKSIIGLIGRIKKLNV